MLRIEQGDLGVPALRFFFTQTLDRPDLARKPVRMRHVRKLPVVLSQDEVARLLAATPCLKHQAALSVAYGAGSRASELAALTREALAIDVDQGITGEQVVEAMARISSIRGTRVGNRGTLEEDASRGLARTGTTLVRDQHLTYLRCLKERGSFKRAC